MKIVDHKIYHDDEKIGWLDGQHVRDASDAKIGYFQDNVIYNQGAHKVAYIRENELVFENGNPSVSLDHINREIEGADSVLAKCAIHVLIEG